MMSKKIKTYMYRALGAIMIGAIFITGIYFLLSTANEGSPDFEAAKEHTGNSEPGFIKIKTEYRSTPIEMQGRVRSKNRLEIFPEVQGRITYSEKPFKEGIAFQKGETIIQIDDTEARLQLYASRSGFITQIASLIPDVKLDFPGEMEAFEQWFVSLKAEETLPGIPDFENSQMRRFLTSRGVYDRYYQIRSAEDRLEKFIIRAPFSGILSSTKAEPGQLATPQAHLGTLVDPDSYLLMAPVRRYQLEYIRTGDTVEVRDQDGIKSWQAEIVRVNPALDPRTQTVEIYLELQGNGIREGQYLEGVYKATDPQRVAEIPKSSILRNGYVYALRNETVVMLPIKVVDAGRTTVWVSGLNDGEEIARDAGKPLGGQIITKEGDHEETH